MDELCKMFSSVYVLLEYIHMVNMSIQIYSLYKYIQSIQIFQGLLNWTHRLLKQTRSIRTSLPNLFLYCMATIHALMASYHNSHYNKCNHMSPWLPQDNPR